MVRTELYIDGANGTDGFLSFPFGVNIPVSLNFNLADVRNPEQRKASFSKTINLIGTNEVNKLFENLFEVNVVTQYFNKNLKTPVKYLVDGLENFAGDLQLIKININPDNSIVYECSIIGAGGSLFVDIGEKYITGNPLTVATSGLLIIGRKYRIATFVAGDNFTSVANVVSGTINTTGCIFIAIGTTPTTWTNLSILTSSDDLDFSAYDHDYTRINQIASWSDVGSGTSYAYPLIDRGTNGGSDNVWNVKDFLPCFSIYEYVKKIIEGTGRTFTSTFFETAEFKKLYCYPNIDKLSLTQAQLDNKQFYVGAGDGSGYSLGTTLMTLNKFIFDLDNELDIPFFDGGNQYSNPNATIASNGTYNIVSNQVLSVTWSHTNPVVNEARWQNLGIRSSIEFSIDNGTTWNVLNSVSSKWKNQTINSSNGDGGWTQSVASGDIYLAAGTMLRMTAQRYIIGFPFNPILNLFLVSYYDSVGNQITTGTGTFNINYETLQYGLGDIYPNTTFYCLTTIKEISEGEFLEVNNLLPKNIKQKDFFKSVVQAFNLYVDIDPDNENNLIIETFDDFYNADIIDYENRTDLGKEQTINPNLLEGKRYIYSYKQDKDYYNTLYQTKWNEAYGTEQIDVENDFVRSDKKTELIFSATPQVSNLTMGIAIPKIYQKDGTTIKSIAANIRMLYFDLKVNASLGYTYKQQGENDLFLTDYLYAGMEDDPFNPTVSLMFGTPKDVYYNYVQAYFTNNNLYNRYYKNYLKNLIDKDAKFVTKYLWLTPKDINQFSFRNRLFIDGSYYIVNKIENYTPLEQTSTKVELIKLLEADVFTPESKLIYQSTDIDAGVDVQNYILNSSLNVGTNIQNRGTNCLAIGENIVIPESCNNLIVFGSNITADENSTGLLLNYKNYVALITQVGTAAPTAIVLENTLGEVTFNYVNVGNYEIVTSGLFTSDKTFISIPNSRLGTNFVYQVDTNTLRLFCRDITSETPFIPYLNNALNKTSIEIRVYN